MARRKLARADLARTQAQFYRLAIARWRDEERNRRCHPLDSRFTGASPAPHNAINRLGGRELRLAENVIAIHAAQPSADRSEEHTSELQSLMRISYAVFCLKKKK